MEAWLNNLQQYTVIKFSASIKIPLKYMLIYPVLRYELKESGPRPLTFLFIYSYIVKVLKNATYVAGMTHLWGGGECVLPVDGTEYSWTGKWNMVFELLYTWLFYVWRKGIFVTKIIINCITFHKYLLYTLLPRFPKETFLLHWLALANRIWANVSHVTSQWEPWMHRAVALRRSCSFCHKNGLVRGGMAPSGWVSKWEDIWAGQGRAELGDSHPGTTNTWSERKINTWFKTLKSWGYLLT